VRKKKDSKKKDETNRKEVAGERAKEAELEAEEDERDGGARGAG
jgi:hypothetical protein